MPAVLSLFLATFCIGTTEVVIAGLLPAIAAEMGVSIPTSGFLVTGYALAVAIGGPILTVLTARLPRRPTILALMAVFVIGHVIAATANDYSMLLLARLLTATAHGCFAGLAIVLAASLVPAAMRGRAIAMVFGGFAVANIVGVPAGTLIGTALGWRWTFWIVGAVGLCATLAIATLVPSDKSGDRTGIPVRAQFVALANPTVLTAFGLIVLTWIALWSTLTYIAPILIIAGGLPEAALPWAMLALGGGATIGIFTGGRLADLAPAQTIGAALPSTAVLFGVGLLIASNGLLFSVVVFLVGVSLGVLVAPLQNRVLSGAAAAPDLASTLTSSAFNVGIALGATFGAAALTAGFGYGTLPGIGLVTTLAAIVLWFVARNTDRRVTPVLASTSG